MHKYSEMKYKNTDTDKCKYKKKAFAKIFMVKHHGFVWGVQTEKEEASLTEYNLQLKFCAN